MLSECPYPGYSAAYAQAISMARQLAPDAREIEIIVDYRPYRVGYTMLGFIRLGRGRWHHESRLFDQYPSVEQAREFAAYVAQMKLKFYADTDGRLESGGDPRLRGSA